MKVWPRLAEDWSIHRVVPTLEKRKPGFSRVEPPSADSGSLFWCRPALTDTQKLSAVLILGVNVSEIRAFYRWYVNLFWCATSLIYGK